MRHTSFKKPTTATSETKTYYFRDAKGNVLSTYRLTNNVLTLTEQDIYGSSRLGLWKPNTQLYPSVNVNTATDIEGQRRYELSNHLGNVLAVITDRKEGKGGVLNGNYLYFEAVTVTATDYFPFGMTMPGRSVAIDNYRYSFNGKEDDSEWAKQDYGFRIYDKRIGRFLSVDPIAKKYPELTPYQFASNTPIIFIDLDGLEGTKKKPMPSHVVIFIPSDKEIKSGALKVKGMQQDWFYITKKSISEAAKELDKY